MPEEATEPFWSPLIQEEMAIDKGLGDSRGTVTRASNLDFEGRFNEFVL